MHSCFDLGRSDDFGNALMLSIWEPSPRASNISLPLTFETLNVETVSQAEVEALVKPEDIDDRPILLSHLLDSQNVLRLGGPAANTRVRLASVPMILALLHDCKHRHCGLRSIVMLCAKTMDRQTCQLRTSDDGWEIVGSG